jgi:5-methylcytosine-specific restriction endonuclease McrA
MLAEYVESPFGTSVTRDHVVPRKMVQKTIKMPPKPKKSVSKRTMRAWRQACQSIYEANLRGCCARCNHSKGGRSLTPNLVAELAASRIESVCPCD